MPQLSDLGGKVNRFLIILQNHGEQRTLVYAQIPQPLCPAFDQKTLCPRNGRDFVSPLATLAFELCVVGDTGLKTGWVRCRHGARGGAGRGGGRGHSCVLRRSISVVPQQVCLSVRLSVIPQNHLVSQCCLSSNLSKKFKGTTVLLRWPFDDRQIESIDSLSST